METKNSSIIFIIILIIASCLQSNTIIGQACSGHWVKNQSGTFQCISGQLIGTLVPGVDPVGCPINPLYPGTQSNTYVFDNPVNDFFIDMSAFTSTTGCARMQIKINGVFYPLTLANLTELPSGTFCSGSLSFLTVTPDGYLTTNSLAASNSNGQARLVFSGVNASSITISTNDSGGGSAVADPCMTPLPIQILSFMGFLSTDCIVTLNFESGIESNVHNIEVQESSDAISYSKVIELLPKGNDSRYTVSFRSSGSNFYRLKINDWDGTYEYSNVIHVKSSCNQDSYQISPNPAKNKIQISGIKLNDRVRILDMQGRIVKRLPTIPVAGLDIAILPSGMYLVQVVQENKIVANLRLVKQ